MGCPSEYAPYEGGGIEDADLGTSAVFISLPMFVPARVGEVMPKSAVGWGEAGSVWLCVVVCGCVLCLG